MKECTGVIILNKKREKVTIGKGGHDLSEIKACLEECFGRLMLLRMNGEYLSLSIFAGGIILFSELGEDLQRVPEECYPQNSALDRCEYIESRRIRKPAL